VSEPTEPTWLTLEEVLTLQRTAIEVFGGLHGVRDMGGLESALAMPQSGFGGYLQHPDIWTQAAAYCFHIVKNHPFLDGNKRAGLMAARIFLGLNGWFLAENDPSTDELIRSVAEGGASKEELASFFRANSVFTGP